MRKGRIFRTIGVGFMLLSLLAVSTYATAGNTPLAMQPPAVQDLPDVQSPGSPAPEIHAGVYTDDYFVMQAIAGQPLAQKEGLPPPNDLAREGEDGVPPDSLLPSAIEGQPQKLDVTAVHSVAVRPNYPQTIYAALEYGQGLWRSTNGGTFWDHLPFGVGGGQTIVFANSSVAIATFGYYDGADYVNGGVWRTGDGGNNWQNVGAAIPNMVAAVAFDPTNSNRIYAATLGAGIYRGDWTGSSVTWTPINSGLPESFFLSIAVSPSNPSVLYAGGLNWVYRGENYGASWVVADNYYPSYYTAAVAVSPASADTFYAGARRSGVVLSTGLTDGGFYKSTSGAGDYNLVLKNSGMQDTFVLDIVQDPVNSSYLYAGTWANGFFRSDDGGDTWVEKNAGLALPYIYGIEAVPDPGNPGGTILYVATFYINHGVYVSTDRGETWTDPWGYTFPNMFDITTTSDAYHLAAATESGVVFSNNGGASWTYSLGLTNGEDGIVLELARDPNNGSKLLAATYGGGIWRSTNAGQSWTESSAGIGGSSYVYDLGFRPGSSTTAYAGSWGVYATTDGGSNWAPLGSVGQWVRDVDALGASSYDLFAGTHDAGVYKSPASNGTWSPINTGLGELRIRSVKALASNEVFAGTNGSSAWEYNGSSWTKKALTIRAPGIRAIAIHPTNSAVIYATSDQGVYKSTNSGESWTPKNQGLGGYGDLAVYSISIDPTNPNTIYLGTWGYGIFKSVDGGDHWTRLSDPLKCSKVYLPVVIRNFGNMQPVASFTYYCTDLTCYFDASGSYDPDGTIISYQWNFGDGNTGSGMTASHAFPGDGTYYVTLTVTDNESATGGNTQPVTVSAGPGPEILWEDFEGTFPGSWTVYDQDSTNGYYYWGKRNCRAYEGSYSGWAAGAGSSTLGCGSSYPTYMVSWMISPAFSMADADGGEMTFKMWLNSEYEYDGVCRMASTNGTDFNGYCTTGNSGGWIDRVLDLGGYAGQPNVWVALIFISDESITYSEGAYVDNIRVHKWSGTPDLPGAGETTSLPDTVQEKPASMTRP